MATAPGTYEAGQPRSGASTGLLLLLAWLWVGIPLAWGVKRTVTSAMNLLTAPAAASTQGMGGGASPPVGAATSPYPTSNPRLNGAGMGGGMGGAGVGGAGAPATNNGGMGK